MVSKLWFTKWFRKSVLASIGVETRSCIAQVGLDLGPSAVAPASQRLRCTCWCDLLLTFGRVPGSCPLPPRPICGCLYSKYRLCCAHMLSDQYVILYCSGMKYFALFLLWSLNSQWLRYFVPLGVTKTPWGTRCVSVWKCCFHCFCPRGWRYWSLKWGGKSRR